MKTKYTLLKFLVCSYIICCLVGRFGEIKSEIEDALKMWASVLVPSLFPYLVISQYISSSGMLSVLIPLQKIAGKLFNISAGGAGVWICSLVCGYPSGAMCTSQLYKNGVIEKDEAERLVTFTNNAGPLFLISAVGGCMLGCTRDGFSIYVIQSLSAAIFGIISGLRAERKSNTLPVQPIMSKPLTECCRDGVSAMLNIGGYLIIAASLGKIIMMTIETMPFYTESYESYFRGGVYFALEISAAMKALSSIEHSALNFAMICAAASWAGVSVIMQIKACLPKDLSIKKIVVARAIQSSISFGSGYAYKTICGECQSCNPNRNWIIISLIACVIIFVGYIILKRKATGQEKVTLVR